LEWFQHVSFHHLCTWPHTFFFFFFFFGSFSKDLFQYNRIKYGEVGSRFGERKKKKHFLFPMWEMETNTLTSHFPVFALIYF
jgi:hypothetical protein